MAKEKFTKEKLAGMIQREFVALHNKIDSKVDRLDVKLSKKIDDSALTDQRIERKLDAVVREQDKHTIELTDHDKRISVLEEKAA